MLEAKHRVEEAEEEEEEVAALKHQKRRNTSDEFIPVPQFTFSLFSLAPKNRRMRYPLLLISVSPICQFAPSTQTSYLLQFGPDIYIIFFFFF